MEILKLIDNWLRGAMTTWFTGHVPLIFVDILAWIVATVVILLFVSLLALILIYLERKVAAYIQGRIGPERVGPWGLLQTVMDALKLLEKEDIVPAAADHLLHTVAPVAFFMISVLGYLVIPWEETVTIAKFVDLNVGLLYLLAISSLAVIGVLMGGWGSNNKWSLLGAMRGAAQMISYEVPMLLALICVVLQAGSLSLGVIVDQQKAMGLLTWNLWHPWLWLPLIIYLVCATAEVNRVPFDIPAAESELVAGFHTEYSGMKFAFFFLAEYANLFMVGMLFATLFLGGWASPFGYPDPLHIPGVLWLLFKAMLVVIFMMWVSWTLPRLRVDQLMSLAWKLLIPASFLSLVVVSIVMLYR
ncbi:MAG TPA: NADH-quinone oxidoreductase subunit NuoH [Armatimonadota bacterium]|jgi:NADH-quinone oxidoreductase subunit H